MPHRAQIVEFRGTAREGHSELREDLVELMCDLPTVMERAGDILLEGTMLSGPCSDPTQMGCAVGLHTRGGRASSASGYKALTSQQLPHLLFSGPKTTRDFNAEVVQHIADDVPPVVAGRHSHSGDCG